MDKTSLQALFATAGLSRLTKYIDLLAQPSIRLHTTPVGTSPLSIGASRIGGMPDLPSGINWPQWKGLPQSFIAQINLEDVHQYDSSRLLPPHGMLWFFYDAQQQTFGETPHDLGGWRVLFANNDLSHLQHTPPPPTLPTGSVFRACSTRFASEVTLSQQPQLEIPHLDWTEAEQQQYENLLSTFPAPDDRASIHHRLLGYPDTIQDDMRLACQLLSHGITDTSDSRIAAVSQGANDWQLLLQIDSDEQAGMRWANNGMLYYWIKRADLQSRYFDRIWLVLQSE